MSDCWEELEKVATQAYAEVQAYERGRADAIDELFDKAFDVDMDSSLIYIKFDREKFGNPFFKNKCDLKNWFTEQLKEQKHG